MGTSDSKPVSTKAAQTLPSWHGSTKHKIDLLTRLRGLCDKAETIIAAYINLFRALTASYDSHTLQTANPNLAIEMSKECTRLHSTWEAIQNTFAELQDLSVRDIYWNAASYTMLAKGSAVYTPDTITLIDNHNKAVNELMWLERRVTHETHGKSIEQIESKHLELKRLQEKSVAGFESWEDYVKDLQQQELI